LEAMSDQSPLSLFRTNLYFFRNSLISLHSVDPSCEPLIRECENVCRLLLEPPSFNIIPDLPEKTALIKGCSELCQSLRFSLNDLLASIAVLRDAVEPTSSSTSAKCTSLIDTLRTGANLDSYWDFYEEHAEELSNPEFSEILKKIEYAVLVGQVIEKSKPILDARSHVPDSEIQMERLVERTTQLSKEIRELQPNWTRFEEYLDDRFAKLQAKMRSFEQRREEIVDSEKSIAEIDRIRLQSAAQFEHTMEALEVLRQKIIAEKQRRADNRSEVERLRKVLSEAQEKLARLEGEAKAAPNS
jgi:chromosome segregation ATPase